MEKKIVVNSVPSISVGTLVFITLIVLKALKLIGMSWFWVITSIIWAPVALTIAILLGMLLFAFIAALISK